MHRRTCLILALTLLVACSDNPAGPGPDPDPLPRASAALVSAPVAAATGAPQTSSVRNSGSRVFVSMPPGTEPGGTAVTIRVIGREASRTAPMVGGGFDPIAIEAVAGDSLTITVARPSGAEVGYARVPAGSTPVVVRTAPRHRRVDVPLNQVIEIVFNEPMDPTTLGPAIRLLAAGVELAGTVTAVAVGDDVLGAQFAPDGLLEAGTTYAIEVSTTARNRAGTPLDTPVEAEFTTGNEVTAPTGTLIVLTSTTGPDQDADGYNISIDDGELQPVASNGTITMILAAAADGHSVQLSGVSGNCTLSGPSRQEIRFSAGISTTVAFEVGCQSDFRPTGMIAFTIQEGSTWSIFTSQADGSGRVQIASGPGRIGQLAWSPDGERLAFPVAGPDRSDIFIMDADGSNLVQRTDVGENDSPTWSPDGRQLAFASLRDNRTLWGIYVMDVDGDWRDVARIGPALRYNPGPAWSPDGASIAFADVNGLSSAGSGSGVYLMRADGSEASELPYQSFRASGRPVWSPDGATIAVPVWWGWDYASSLMLIRTDGSEERHLRFQAEAWAPAWSPDGAMIAFVSECDLYVACVGFATPDGRRSSVSIRNAGGAAWRP